MDIDTFKQLMRDEHPIEEVFNKLGLIPCLTCHALFYNREDKLSIVNTGECLKCEGQGHDK